MAAPDLPAPPLAFEQLKKDGNVAFVFYDAAKFPRQYAGETRFRIDYQAESNFRWRLIRQANGQRSLVIRTGFSEPQFQIQHQILLPSTTADQQFYLQRLVRHEFDHVRVSADPRYRNLLAKWLKDDLKVVRVEIDGEYSKRELNSLASKAVKEQADQLFQKMLELIQIRYSELDRTTRHGTEALPDDFFSEDDSVNER